MKHYITKSLGLCVILFCLVFTFFVSSHALAANKVMIVVSVSLVEAEKISTHTIIMDTIKGLIDQEHAELKFHYVNFKNEDNDAAKTAKGLEAVKAVREYQPNVVITEFDDALKYVGLKIDDIPVVFTWIFGEPESFGLPKTNVTGIIRRSYAPDSWALTKQLLGIKTVGLLCKNGASMKNRREAMLKSSLVLEKASGVKFTDMYLVDTMGQWKYQIANWKEDLIHLGDISRITDGNRTVMPAELMKWTIENAKVPVIAALENDVKDGALLSIVTSEQEAGYLTGMTALKILKGTKVSSIPFQTINKGKLVINIKTAQKIGIEIPYEILNSADKIYQ